jgi:hypothetical protein
MMHGGRDSERDLPGELASDYGLSPGVQGAGRGIFPPHV